MLDSEPQYPIKPDPNEEKFIEEALEILNTNLQTAKEQWRDIRNNIGKPTRSIEYLKMRGNDVLFNNLKEHMYEAVLLVAIRFGWPPEEILALWQIEGLPAWHKYEQDTPSKQYLPICKIFSNVSNTWIQLYQREPHDADEARAWARSRVLWTRWGLDELMPYRRDVGDNIPSTASREVHDRKFSEGFVHACNMWLLESPFDYLSSADTSPFEVRKRSQIWEFRTHPEYQTTMLALQYARFRTQFRRMPPSIEHRDSIVNLDEIFPALSYMFFNSRNAEGHLEKMAKRMIDVDKRRNSLKEVYSSDDLYSFYVSTPIPDDVRKWIIQRNNPSAHSYVNALRFEYLRQVYQIVFANLPTYHQPIGPREYPPE